MEGGRGGGRGCLSFFLAGCDKKQSRQTNNVDLGVFTGGVIFMLASFAVCLHLTLAKSVDVHLQTGGLER